jgi:DNA polymerase-3 subunit delta
VAKAGLTYDALRESLASRRFATLYLFHGEEDFLLEKAVEAVLDASLAVAEREFNLDVLRAGDTDVRDIVARASAFPMMAERRVVLVREAEKITGKDADIFCAYAEHPSPTTVMVVVTAKADFRRKPFTVLKRTGVVLECKRLWENQMPGWIAGRARARGRELEPDAVKLLCAYVGASLRETENEIEKLVIYAGDRTTLSADDIAAVVGISKEFSVFELQRAVGARNLPRSAVIMQRMLEVGESVPFIVVMLTNYFVALWKLRELRRPGIVEADQAAGAKIPAFALREYAEALRRYSAAEVERAFILLASADEQIKTTSADHGRIMLTLLVQLMGGEHVTDTVEEYRDAVSDRA